MLPCFRAGFCWQYFSVGKMASCDAMCWLAIFSRAVLGCVRAMKKAEDNCYRKLPPVVEQVLCWPLKLTAFCKIADGL